MPEFDDAEGLRRAYENIDGNDSYIRGNTMYVRGSVTASDWLHDDPLLPLGGWGTRQTYRYQTVARTLKANPQVRRIVGHSLSSAVALQIQKDNPGKYETTAYSSPIFSVFGEGGDRVRSVFDPIAMFDTKARTKVTGTLNPHTYTEIAAGRQSRAYADDIATRDGDGYRNQDGSISLFR